MIDDSELPVGDSGEKKGTAMIKQTEDLWTPGTRDAVLQILGNIVNNSAAAQNKMREVGGIELVLNHTKMHPKHPLQREWALFTVAVRCLIDFRFEICAMEMKRTSDTSTDLRRRESRQSLLWRSWE